MNKQLASLLGILFTDGCVSPKGVHSWRIYFVNKSESLINEFRMCMMICFNLDSHRVRIGNTRDGLVKAVVDSKEIGTYLVKAFGTFRTLRFKDGTLPNTRLPTTFLMDNNLVGDFLRAAFSCDGGVSFYAASRKGKKGGTRWLIRNVFLSCAHPQLRSDYLFLLETLGITAKHIPNDGVIRIQTQENIKKFRQHVGFVPGTRATNASRFWSGYEKQDILELLIESYGNPSTIYDLPRFHLR